MSLDDVMAEICYPKGCPNMGSLRDAIRKWAKVARSGGVFKTAGSVIIASGR